MVNVVRTVQLQLTDEEVSFIVSGLKDLNDFYNREKGDAKTLLDNLVCIKENKRIINMLEHQTFSDYAIVIRTETLS